jgi:hypothetical protein
LTFGVKDNRRGATLVAHGLVTNPSGPILFAHASARELAITGGTGRYEARQGYISLTDPEHLSVLFSDSARYLTHPVGGN